MSASSAKPRKGVGGRPKKAEHERRVAALHADVTLAEKSYARTQAENAGLTLSEYIRRRCLDFEVTPRKSKVDIRLIRELNSIGVLLNQIARNLNSGREGTGSVDIIELRDHLVRTLDRALEALDD